MVPLADGYEMEQRGEFRRRFALSPDVLYGIYTGCERPPGASADAVSNAIGQILDALTSAKCRNYFLNAGYGPA